MRERWLGIDVGSTTVKLVLLDGDRRILAHRYLRGGGRPRQTLLEAVAGLGSEVRVALTGAALTGSGGAAVAALLGAPHVNELVAQARAVGTFHPEARTIIEIGGQDSKFLSVKLDEETGEMDIVDFAMNTLCAAGTGSFLDQQAERLGIRIDGEFADLALRSTTPARLAGRCTVFAKSDMIHLQQQGTPLPDILAGLCLALARNFKGVIGKGKSFTPPVLFQGGVAANAAVVRAFETTLGLAPGQIIVPEHHRYMAALGAAFFAMDRALHGEGHPFAGFAPLREAVRTVVPSASPLPALRADAFTALPAATAAPTEGAVPVALGVDVGSISTNVVLVDEEGRVVARRYVRTAGRPLEAVRGALLEVGTEVAGRVAVRAVGTTGSGRYLVGDYVGADVVRNEITAQARAALAVDGRVDTIFELGGQDSKYIRLQDGAVVDFAMNNACAAGTGSFLEEQAARLRMAIEDEFSAVAFSSPAPACLGERCTVFMESDLVHHQQRGAGLEDLTAGLAYSVVENYLNRVVSGRPIGKKVFFQGGVAWNRAVAAAFAQQTGREIVVPPHHDVTGAIGAALLAREALSRPGAPPTRFKGFDLSGRAYRSRVFVCRACPNLCEVNRVTIGDEPPAYHGARCDKFEGAGRDRARTASAVPDPFAERQALLLGEWTDPGSRNGHLRVAIPRALTFFDIFPFWRGFFRELQVDLVLSSPTSAGTVQKAQEQAVIEACFPVKLIYGHLAELRECDADFVLLPAVVDRENVAAGQARNHYCPFIPAVSYVVAANMDLAARGPRPLVFPLHMLSARTANSELAGALRGPLGVSARALARAAEAGRTAQREFYAAVRRRGREILESLERGQAAAVVVSRPYNSSDPGASQDLPYTLRKLGVLPLPTDFLPLENAGPIRGAGDMYWRCGQDILAAARVIADDERLQAVYLTNFNCGPDSFLLGFFRRLMNGKPFLELEVDDHTADAGIVTRCEAFFDSLRSRARS